ncbi:MAG: aldo/keto reductase [Proteobacteria bacterium]|nr:aldo/keto reductase [Pseudomonadota bacterium]
MPERTLSEGLIVSSLGYGAMGMSEFYGPSNDLDSKKLLNEVLDRGVTFIDTADIYGQGHNELLIGDLLRSRQDIYKTGQLKIATKCGIEWPADTSSARRINNRPEYIRRCCEASLKRLGVDRIDVYYIHRLDTSIDIDESMGCLADLVKEGKIEHIGLCEVSAKTLRRAHQVHPVSVLQSEYSLWSREVEQDILPLTQELGIGFVAYSPLGRGFLSGRIRNTDSFAAGDFRCNNPRFEQTNLNHNLVLLETVLAVATNYSVAPSQVALAWLLAQGPHIVPIPGTRRSTYLQENLGALALTLTTEDLKKLDHAMPASQVRGSRYSSEGMKGINA